jgi:gluconokinase
VWRIVVMGVAGSGKSVVGAALAQALGIGFCDADGLHPASNIAKMTGGLPLSDADRWPWLDLVAAELVAHSPLVLACSALRRAYRDRIRAGAGGPVLFIHLTGPREVIAARLAARKGHFMPPALLDSQLATLEPPGAGEDHLEVDITRDLPEILARLREDLAARGG